MIERSVIEELVELLEKKNTDFMLLRQMNKAPKALRDRIKLRFGANQEQVEEALSPYLGDVLTIKKKTKSKYLIFNQPDEVLLLRIIQRRSGALPSTRNIPFRKDEYLSLLNHMIESGSVRVKINKNYKPVIVAIGKTLSAHNSTSRSIDEAFHAAFCEFEGGRNFVYIYELRRRLRWTKEDFDSMLRKLRDTGKIELNAADASVLNAYEIKDSFVDENGTRMGTVTWL